MDYATIAVIEDESIIAAAVAARLRREGFKVEVAPDGPSGVELCERSRPDLVVLDVMLPGFDGLEVCRRIQRERPVPVLMLTARDSETDMLVGLGIGADDYMTKPFSPRELVARVRALLRRARKFPSPPDTTFRVGDLEVDPARRQVRREEQIIHLTPIEFELLYTLAARPGVVFTREQLLSEVWGYREGFGGRTVDSHVGALRRKLGSDLLRTVHGVGYAVESGGI
ncbi:MAG TPA: response regulator transcription factor [Actinomycetota bacterium]|jgi:DNA-binding response OmpR family regulator|nr:response regulator transcription factor [Actinomycetota bacterium]